MEEPAVVGKEKLEQMGLIVISTPIKERDICSELWHTCGPRQLRWGGGGVEVLLVSCGGFGAGGVGARESV